MGQRCDYLRRLQGLPATYTATRILKPTLTPTGATLVFESQIQYNIYFRGTDLDGLEPEDFGLITWNNAIDGDISNAHTIISGAVYTASTDEYMVATQGIPAKNLGDVLYFKVYAQLPDGSFIYSDMLGYSGKNYAESRIKNSTNPRTVALCIAMLNYGAAAQEYFSYKPYALINSALTDEQQALIKEYDESMLTQLNAAAPSKTVNFTATNNSFSAKSVAVEFQGAFIINYYFTPSQAVDDDLLMYWWDADVYAAEAELTAENASGCIVMTPGAEYSASIMDIAAKKMDEAIYVAGVYTSGGVTHCTGVLTYSLGRYFQSTAANGASAMQTLSKAAAVYGYYAKEYFANL